MTRDTSSGDTDEWYDRDFSPVGINLRNEEQYRQVQAEVGRLTGLYDDVKRADIYGMMMEYATIDSEERPDTFEGYVQLRISEKEEKDDCR